MTSILSTYRLPESHTIWETIVSHRYGVVTASCAAIVVPWAIRDYRTYLSYGPGGLPYNVFGWAIANSVRLFTREQMSTKPYTSQNTTGILPPNFPPQRKSERPTFGPHPVPQRQLSQLPNEKIREQLISRFEALGESAQAKGLVEMRQSQLERQHMGLFVSKSRSWNPTAQDIRGEISHVHAGLDGSIHVVLHPSDCKKVIEAGWGQRHGFSGVTLMKRALNFMLPVNYILIYAPRDEAELEIALKIVDAGIAFMTVSTPSL